MAIVFLVKINCHLDLSLLPEKVTTKHRQRENTEIRGKNKPKVFERIGARRVIAGKGPH